MKQVLVMAICALLLTSPSFAQPATPSDDLLPTAQDLGPGWVKLTYKLPSGDPDYPEARGWYTGPDGARAILLVSVPPADSLFGIWEEIAQRVEADAPAALLSPEHPSATIPPIEGCAAVRRASRQVFPS